MGFRQDIISHCDEIQYRDIAETNVADSTRLAGIH